jgi:hypothetical protein
MQFLKFPVTPSSAPTTNYQVANKKYVDDEIDSHSHSGYAQTLIFTSKSVLTTAFVSDSTYTDYDYIADVSCSGVTSDYVPTVNFNVDEAVGGNFAPVALSGTNKITIYAKEVPSATITIPSIVCIKAVS